MKKLSLFLMMTIPLTAKYHGRVTSQQEFERLIDTYEYSLVCFASSGKYQQENIHVDDLKDRNKDFKNIQKIVHAAASNREFKKYLAKDVGFIMVNDAAKRLEPISNDLNISTDQPTCYMFKQGVADTNSKLENPTSSYQIVDFIDEIAGDPLQKILEERKKEERVPKYYPYGGFYLYPWGESWGGSSYWARNRMLDNFDYLW